MSKAQNLTQEELKLLLEYNPELGNFIWKVYRCHLAVVGQIAGYVNHGYTQIAVKGIIYMAHRLAYFYMTGELPPKGMEIDHKNGIKTDNRWENLRLGTKSQNQHNRKPNKNALSGFKGLTWSKPHSKWRVRIQHNGIRRDLGLFDTKEEAARAYDAAALELFGEFAQTNGHV